VPGEAQIVQRGGEKIPGAGQCSPCTVFPATMLPPAAGGFAPKLPFRLNDYRMCKALLPLKLLVDADDWPFFGKTKLIFYNFCFPC